MDMEEENLSIQVRQAINNNEFEKINSLLENFDGILSYDIIDDVIRNMDYSELYAKFTSLSTEPSIDTMDDYLSERSTTMERISHCLDRKVDPLTALKYAFTNPLYEVEFKIDLKTMKIIECDKKKLE